MSKKTAADATKNVLVFEVDPTECPFREFRDNELHPEFWGLGPAAYRAAVVHSKSGSKPQADHVWLDDQTQPLPRSVRQYLNGWVRAEDLASNRWKAEAIVFEETGGNMSVADIQLSHAQVLLRSSFCRKALSACFLLERVDTFTVEHQWDSFSFSIAPEGWRARYHIYSPGMKPGGGQQHRPGLSKNGCYLVRLFYLGAWRCVWVSDQVPVDANDSPLLPFSPLLSNVPVGAKTSTKPAITTVTSPVVHLWPLLICKALLKLAVPDMNPDEELDSVEDELLADFNIMHSLTGSMSLTYKVYDPEELWRLITSEVPVFAWDDDDDTLPSTVKSKGAKKPTTKEATVRSSMASILIADTKNEPPYALPGITPAYEMDLVVSMARDLPLKKPLQEPDVALWKHYRWVDWARGHGLYEAYDCPRVRFLKVNGLLKLSYAPHLLDVLSTESITAAFREEHERTVPIKKGAKEANRSATGNIGLPQGREELREWVQYNPVHQLVQSVSILFYPSMYQFTSAGSNPPVRITKGPPKPIDIAASKCAPMYLQIDGPEVNTLRISLNALHPRIVLNSGVPILDFIEPAHLVLEKFEWFVDSDVPMAKAFVQTRGYDSVEIQFEPGRHICRLWVHSRINWHVMLLSESALLLGTRNMIQCAAIRECPWASKFLSQLGTAFANWIKVNRSNTNVLVSDKEFYKSYQPDLTWDPAEVGYDKSLLHWMFRQALKSLLARRLQSIDYRNVCIVLRRYFCDPDFGLPEKPRPQKSFREIATMDPCDCLMPEAEDVEQEEECLEEQQVTEEKPLVDESTMAKLLTLPTYPITSQVCELATEELPCGVLKEEREIVIKRHEAATVLQAHWRGAWARKCLRTHVVITPDVLKAIMENSFGNFEALSALMNEFFAMYPEVKPAYSVASALTGTYGLRQFTGTTPVTPHCRWIPYFQGVFHCHEPVKVHFDVQSSVQYSTVAVYDNDTGIQMPQVYNAHITFDFTPNLSGYTVMGHSTLNQPAGINTDAHWQLTILTSIDEVFHVCDNDLDECREQPLPHSHKLHLDEVFLPNRRNILGGIQISVLKNEAISFRAAASSPDLEIKVIFQTTIGGQMQTIAKCCGKGEVYWPYVRLESMVPLPPFSNKNSSKSQSNLNSMKTMPPDPKIYFIEVVAPQGWPLTMAQWKRVDEIRNSSDFIKLDAGQQPKKPTKEKPTSAKDKDKDKQQVFSILQPQPDDAYTVLECGLAIGGGAFAKRDDDRDVELAAAIKSWDEREPGRNNRGAQIRKDFRTEFLEALPVPPSESVHTLVEECIGEEYSETEGMLEMTVESEEEAKYLTMPEHLRDKFIPLYFVPFCLKEKDENMSVLMTLDIAEAAKKDRHARIEAALDRMRELQVFNELSVLGRQRTRWQLLEQLFVDYQWNPELTEALEARDDAVAKETLNRTLSAAKKKQETKKK